MKVKVYVDTNIILGLVKRDYPKDKMESTLAVMNLRKEGKIDLWVSKIMWVKWGQIFTPVK